MDFCSLCCLMNVTVWIQVYWLHWTNHLPISVVHLSFVQSLIDKHVRRQAHRTHSRLLLLLSPSQKLYTAHVLFLAIISTAMSFQ